MAAWARDTLGNITLSTITLSTITLGTITLGTITLGTIAWTLLPEYRSQGRARAAIAACW